MSYYQGDGGYYPSQPSYSGQGSNLNEFTSALSHAQSHHGSSTDDDHSLFNSALSFLENRKSHYAEPSNNDIDEDKYMRAHQSLYSGQDDESHHDSDSLGAGAAMQALKHFTSGGSGGSDSGGLDKNKLIGMAMAQAGKLWDEKNGAGKASGDKQSAINSAAEAALKMYMKGQGGGIGGTGGPSTSGLMGLASKFLS
ncbi:hypothetical protein PHISCL_00739 [Aspergillus sclerotialis]|uniref:DUF7721 domain-containing protein n=1 Tax=Aspergillus sclerotialis TaxID=2070753 RepID=A0A3A2ZUV8_9EURO|nr:hypothetical protein PHISCL_00739 [Aspergillus sclerotialis]